MFTRMLAIVAMVGCLLVSGRALAATPEEQTANRHIQEGEFALRRHDDSAERDVRAQQLQRAAESFEKAVSAASNYARAYRVRGRFQELYRKDLPAARADYSRAVALGPDDPSNHLSLVLVCFEAMDWTATVGTADELLRRFDQSDPDPPRKYVLFHARERRGLSLLALGKAADSAAELEKAKKLGDRLGEEISGPQLGAYPKFSATSYIVESRRLPSRWQAFRLQHLPIGDEVEWCAQVCDMLRQRIASTQPALPNELAWLWERLEKLEPKSAEGWYGRGEIRRRKLEWQEREGNVKEIDIAKAIADYDAAEKAGLTTPTMLFHRAKLHLATLNEQPALKDFDACFRFQADPPDIAYAYETLGEAISLARKTGDTERLLRFLNYYLTYCDESRWRPAPVKNEGQPGGFAFGFNVTVFPSQSYRTEAFTLLLAKDNAKEILAAYDQWVEKNGFQLYLVEMPEGGAERIVSLLITGGRFADAYDLLMAFDGYDRFRDLALDQERLMLGRLMWKPATPQDRFRLAQALRYVGRSREALPIYDALLKEFPQSAVIAANRLMTFLEFGDGNSARALLDRIPDSPLALPYKAAVRGALAQANGQFDQAIAEYTGALAADPYLPGVRGRRALARLGKNAIARATLVDDAILRDLKGAAIERDGLSLCFPWRIAPQLALRQFSEVEPLTLRLTQGDVLSTLHQWQAALYWKSAKGSALAAEMATRGAIGWLAISEPAKAEKWLKKGESITPLNQVAARLKASPVERQPLNQAAPVESKGADGFQAANFQLRELLDSVQARLRAPTVAEDYLLLAWNEAVAAEQLQRPPQVAVERQPPRRPKLPDGKPIRQSTSEFFTPEEAAKHDARIKERFERMKQHLQRAMAHAEKAIATSQRGTGDPLLAKETVADVPLIQRLVSELKQSLPSLAFNSDVKDEMLCSRRTRDLRLALQAPRWALWDADQTAADSMVGRNSDDDKKLMVAFRTACNEREFAKAVQVLEQAARENNVDAVFALARAYSVGSALPEDRHLALRLFLNAAASGNPPAELAAIPPRPLSEMGGGLATRARRNAERIATKGLGRTEEEIRQRDLEREAQPSPSQVENLIRALALARAGHLQIAAALVPGRKEFLVGGEVTAQSPMSEPRQLPARADAAKGETPKAAAVRNVPMPSDRFTETTPPKPDPNAALLRELTKLKVSADGEKARLDAAITGDPDNGGLYEKRALFNLLLGKFEDSLADADKVVALRPNDEDGYVSRFFALSMLGRSQEAEAARAQVQKLGPRKAEQLDATLAQLRTVAAPSAPVP